MNDDLTLNECPLAVVDVETTGLDARVDRVIEIAVVHMLGGEVQERWSSLVNPEREVSDEVIKLTGIDRAALPTAPRFAEVAEEVHRRLVDRVFVAYNLPFDRAFVVAELERAKLSFPDVVPLDPLIFVRELHKNEGAKRLGVVAERLGIPLENAHRATDDAEVAGRVLYAIAPQLPARLGDLRLLQEQWEALQRNAMAGWRGRRESSYDDRVTGGAGVQRGDALGPAYIYGTDTDPVRAMFRHLPDSGGGRRS